MPRKPAASAILIFQGKLLLMLRDNIPTIHSPNRWNAPGGGIEEGETPDDAIKRELCEEVSVIPDNLQPAEMTTHDDGSIVYRYFAILSEQEYKKVKLGDEGQRLEWFTYDEALLLNLSSHFRPYFETQKGNMKTLLNESLL